MPFLSRPSNVTLFFVCRAMGLEPASPPERSRSPLSVPFLMLLCA